jgi:hypothetical protein
MSGSVYDRWGGIFYTGFGGAAAVGATAQYSGTRLGGIGGLASLRSFNTNIFSYAALAYQAASLSSGFSFLGSNVALRASVGFDATGTSLTNIIAHVGVMTRSDTNANISGIAWVYDSQITNVWGCFSVNAATLSGTNWVGPTLMSCSNQLQTLGFYMTNAAAIVFTTNNVPAFTNTTANTFPTNIAMMRIARMSTSTNASTVQTYLMAVDKFQYYDKQ